MDSAEFDRKVKHMEKSKETAAKIRRDANNKPSYDERKAIHMYEEQSNMDKVEIKNTYKEKNFYLQIALK